MSNQTIFDVIKSGDYLVLDTETTGFGSDAEICQIAIIDSNGAVLLNTLVKPVRPIPAEATRIHGITNEMVKDANSLNYKGVRELLNGRDIIVYNAEYDVKILQQSTEALLPLVKDFRWVHTANWYCAMLAFAEIYGEYNPRFDNYRWQRLETACNYYKVKATDAHSALGDCLATLEVCKAMAVKQGLIEDTKR